MIKRLVTGHYTIDHPRFTGVRYETLHLATLAIMSDLIALSSSMVVRCDRMLAIEERAQARTKVTT